MTNITRAITLNRGLHADEIIAMIQSDMQATVKHLSSQSVLWGKDVTDERYLISAIF